MYIHASLLRKTEIQLCIIKMMYYGYCIMFIKYCARKKALRYIDNPIRVYTVLQRFGH